MRLDASNTTPGWVIWHCSALTIVRNCVYIDDELNEFGVAEIMSGRSLLVVYGAAKISIYPALKLAFINPVQDDSKYIRKAPSDPTKPAGE